MNSKLQQLNDLLRSKPQRITITEEGGSAVEYRLHSVKRLPTGHYKILVVDPENKIEVIFADNVPDPLGDIKWRQFHRIDPSNDEEIYRGYYSLTGLNVNVL